MSEEVGEQDTFVSVDMYAPTQSSLDAINQEAGDGVQDDINDTVSLSEYIGDGGDDLLGDDILDQVNLHTDTTQGSNTASHLQFHNDTATSSSFHPSPQLSRAMRQDGNRHDSAFMWTLTDGQSPEALRQDDATTSRTGMHDDSLSLGVHDPHDEHDTDDPDVCSSFDTATLSEPHEAVHLHPHHQQQQQRSSFSRRQSEGDDDQLDASIPPTPHSQSASSHPFTPSRTRPSRRRDSAASIPSPKIPCSSERPPLPPARSTDMQGRRRSSIGRSYASPQVQLQRSPSSTSARHLQSSPSASSSLVQPRQLETEVAQATPQANMTPVSAQTQATPMSDDMASASPQHQGTPISENSMLAHNPKFDEAAHGYSSSIISNPFAVSQDGSGVEWPSNIVLISKTGPTDADDKLAFEELVASADDRKCRLVKRLVETIVFQCRQLEHVKDSEVNLAGSILNDELRRYSDAAHERSFALDGLIEEVDAQRESISELEEENATLKQKLKEAENKVKQVETYYSNIVDDFQLTGNVVAALENVHDGIDKFRRESMEQSQKNSTQVEDYARRLLEMEDIVADSRKRMKRMEMENEDLRRALDGNGVVERKTPSNDDSDDEMLNSPVKSSRYASPDRLRVEDPAEYMRTIEEQHIEIDNLRLLHSKVEEDHKKMQEAFLNLNVELEEARSKVTILQKQRDAAESKNREISSHAASEKKKYVQLADEMSKNIVQVVSELDQREKEMRSLRSDIEDRESVLRSLQCTNNDLEEQLQAFTDAALDRNYKSKNTTIEGSSAQPLVDTFIDSLQKELNKAQVLLQERTNEIERVKKIMQEQDENIIALQKDCSRLQAQAAIRRRSGSTGSPKSVSTANTAEEDRFLRRLSEKLGCSSNGGNRELIEQLAKRVENLMVEREQFQTQLDKMRAEVTDRERGLHKLRSEMQVEIQAMKAEAIHHENLKIRAQEERKNAEERLLHVLNEGDISRRESLGDITASSVGTRAWMINGDETGDDTTRRTSMLSAIATGIGISGEETIRWNDPIIESAVQSVNALIGTKDALADRNRELRERLQALINALAANDHDGSARAVIIQSKELQDELTGVVGMQQDIIDKLAKTHINATPQSLRASLAGTGDIATIAVHGAHASSGSENTLPLINADQTQIQDLITASPSGQLQRTPLGEATRFLNEQLHSARNLYSEKLRANVELCGVVEELREEVRRHLSEAEQYKAESHNVEIALTQLQETHNGFLGRLSVMTGAEPSCVALEDFIRASLHDMVTLQGELEKRDVEERSSLKRMYGLMAQKRLLSHIISLYQNKYRLNILADTPEEISSVKRRLRVRVFAIMAVNKLLALNTVSKHPQSSSTVITHELPEVIDISNAESSEICLMEATLALSAVPRLEKALVEKEQEVAKLESTIESLNRSAASNRSNISGSSEVPKSSFVYEEDMLNRKNDLSRRLQKMIKEKEELEERLSREKQSRLTAEARAVKYMEKVSVYKKRIGKITSQAESKENTYKTAIRYLKSKADKAVQNDFNMDEENVAPLETLQAETDADGNAAREPNASTRAMLQERLNSAEADLADLQPGSEGYDNLKGYAQGLRLAIQRLEKPLVFKRSHRDDANRVNKA